ncbi:MAG: IS4 family transposase [Deltaproteobacteria bacterium]|nr:IS4 family transposase [Deltaproteobacteria bacterium]
MTFVRVVSLILTSHKQALQNALNRFFGVLGRVLEVPTASAYSQARQKLQPALFQYLNLLVVEKFYELYAAAGGVKRWHGRRVVGIDGTMINLPDTAATRQHYSVHRNQHAGGERVQALGSVCYDLPDDLALDATLGKQQAEKESLFASHLAATVPSDVVVLDRGYADYSVMAFLLHHQRDFVIRFPRRGFTAIRAFWASGAQEQVVELRVPDRQKPFVVAHGLTQTLRLRLVKVVLADGQVEVLGTSLLDAKEFPAADLKTVYGWRWGVETYYDRLKNIFEVERFSGHGVLSIEQDFYGLIFLTTLESVLGKGAEAELAQESAAAQRKYVARVNHAVSYLALVDHTVALLLDPPGTVEETLATLHFLFKTNPTLPRPGRRFPRNKVSGYRKLWFHRYIQRTIA